MEQIHKTEKKSWSCGKCGNNYVWEQKFLEHQTTCGEIQKCIEKCIVFRIPEHDKGEANYMGGITRTKIR